MNTKIYNQNALLNFRAIIDTGAIINAISRKFVTENALQTMKCQKPVIGVNGPFIIKEKVKIKLRPWFNGETNIVGVFYVLDEIEGSYPFKPIKANKENIKHLVLADENFDKPATIDAIFNVSIYALILTEGLYMNKSGAIMQNTLLGHIILGKIKVEKSVHTDFPILSMNQSMTTDTYRNLILNINQSVQHKSNELLDALTKFWHVEELNECDNEQASSEEQNAVEKIYANTFYREPNGRYVVTIPIKPQCQGLGDSRGLAYRQFMQGERSLEKKPVIKQQYIEYMREFQKNGYMQLADKAKDPKFTYYLPHHAVQKRFRVVVNASAKTNNGESLNSIQMIGSKLQCDLQLQIMRFRQKKIGITTDIKGMFNRIGLNPNQWDLQRIFWRESPNQALKEYHITVVMFGLASSPYNAVRTLIQCANEYEKQFPKASSVIKNCFYMDDGIFGCDTVEEARILCKEVEFILNQANFNLKTWASNSQALEEYLKKETIDKVLLNESDETKVLGLCWLKTSDELAIVVKPINTQCKTSKRGVLSEISQLYDPNGFISPVIIKAKMIMQEIWKLKEIPCVHL